MADQVQKNFYDWLKDAINWQEIAGASLAYEMLDKTTKSVSYFTEPGNTRTDKYIGGNLVIVDFVFRIEYKVKGDSPADRYGGTTPFNALADFFDTLDAAALAAIPLGSNRRATKLEIVEIPSKAQQNENSDMVFSAAFRLTYNQRK